MCIGKWFDRRLMWLSYRNHGQRSGRQSGFTLLEALASIGVMGAISVGVFSLANQSVQDTRGSLVAMHMKTVGDAASAYIRKNYVAVQSAASNTVPAVIRIDTLIGDGQLTVGYASQNAEGQTVCVLVLKPSATSNSLNALVVSEGGNVTDDLSLGQIAATIGGAGGGIYAADTTQVKGAMSGWSVPVGNFSNSATKCNGTTGKVTLAKGHPAMALWFSDGSSVSATSVRGTTRSP